MSTVTNIAAYAFVPLPEDRSSLQTELKERCDALHLRGSILLATEGINLFLAGKAEAIEQILTAIRSMLGLSELEVKYSYSDYQPFNRMLVKLKKEIIPFAQPSVQVEGSKANKISPQQLKSWLDEGRDIVLLDTRNYYELRLGSFEQALDPKLEHFRDFPAALERLPEELRHKPIVTFCTGGIRCEKAAPYMDQAGFEEVYQLDGGILNYFQECGGAHWQGECFVFDQRVALDPELKETQTTQCYRCQEPLEPQEQAHPHYAPGKHCPYCYEHYSSSLPKSVQHGQGCTQ